MIPRFAWRSKECWWSFVTDLDILTRIAFGALPVRAAELDEEHPGHDERDASTMVRVSGSPKRILETIAVTATPPADQIP